MGVRTNGFKVFDDSPDTPQARGDLSGRRAHGRPDPTQSGVNNLEHGSRLHDGCKRSYSGVPASEPTLDDRRCLVLGCVRGNDVGQDGLELGPRSSLGCGGRRGRVDKVGDEEEEDGSPGEARGDVVRDQVVLDQSRLGWGQSGVGRRRDGQHAVSADR